MNTVAFILLKCRFNTSHVVVYLGNEIFLTKKIKTFQYISCCSLSSSFFPIQYSRFVSIHLMLQFILNYHASLDLNRCFNTSHVVVYPDYISDIPFVIIVSIHLMLQFILPEYDTKNLALHVSIHLMLQFIQISIFPSSWQNCVSIHLMLQFISTLHTWKRLILAFQYISCCSLSKQMSRNALAAYGFNTSHVVVYQC